MRSPLLLATLLLALPLSLASAARFESFEELRGRPPSTYEEVQQEIEDLERHIEEGDMCGGWINQDALAAVQLDDVLTKVRGAPGRSTFVPGFQYPDQAAGYMAACHIQYDRECNPDSLCLIGERTAEPAMCRDIYHYLLEQQAEQEREVVCELEIPTKFDFTETCTGQACRCGVERTYIGDEFGVRLVNERPIEPNADGVCEPGLDVEYPSCAFTPAGTLTFYCPGCRPLRYTARIAPFFRHYGPVSAPEAIPEERYERGFLVESEGQSQYVAADCYEYYIEKDTWERIADDWNKRCEIYETDDSDGDTPEWTAVPQLGGTKPNTDIDPYRDDPAQRTGSGFTPFPWIKDKETSLSLLDLQWDLPEQERIVSHDDITPHLSAVPETKISASKTNEMRANPYDDASDRVGVPGWNERQGVISVWWNQQQKKLLTITRAPAIRILLPARHGLGLDPDDPIVRAAARVETRADGVLEAQLRAGEDALGSILSSLQHSSLLAPREVQIPVLVPMASESELHALIHDWRQWEIRYGRQGAADEIVAKLAGYAEQVRSVRLLRNALASYVTQVLEVEQDVRAFFADWYLQNARQISLWAEEAEDRRLVQEKWRQISERLIELHDGCELKWCSNSRLTTGVYALLDPWLPGRPNLDGLRDPAYQLPEWHTEPDYVIDFSAITLPHEYFYIPTLEVTQVRIALPTPPLGNGAIPDASLLSDIPQINPLDLMPEVLIFYDMLELPAIHTPALDPEKHVVPSPSKQDYKEVLEKLSLFETIISRARDSYCQFRNSIEGRDDPPRKIVHTEYDLRERIERLFARRASLVRQDYETRFVLRDGDMPPCSDETDGTFTCILPAPEESISFRWQISLPSDSPDRFDTLFDDLRDATLPEIQEDNPYYQAPVEWLRRLFLPNRIDTPSRPLREIDVTPPPILP